MFTKYNNVNITTIDVKEWQKSEGEAKSKATRLMLKQGHKLKANIEAKSYSTKLLQNEIL